MKEITKGKIDKKEESEMWLKESMDAFRVLVKQLSVDIKKHKYDVIIGDDTSGRIPALVIGGLMKEINKKDGLKEPSILFLAGYSNNRYYINPDTGKGEFLTEENKNKWMDNLSKYFEHLENKNKINSKSKILLVTDYLDYGYTLSNFLDFFKKNNFDVTVASLETAFNTNFDRKEIKVYNGKQELTGRTAILWDNNIGEKGLRFLMKNRVGDIFAKLPILDKKLKNNKLNVDNIRKYIKIMISGLKDYYNYLNNDNTIE